MAISIQEHNNIVELPSATQSKADDNKDDDKLIKRAQSGNEQAFAQLITHHYDRMYRFAYRWIGNQSDAQDITQQACIKLARCLAQYRFESTFTTWLYRLVVTCAQDWQRKEKKHRLQTESPQFQFENDMDIELRGSSNEDHVYLQQILTMIEARAEGFKEAVLLVLAEGMSHREAAEILNVEESTISWRLHSVRKLLAAQQDMGATQ